MNLPDAPIAHEGFFATHFFARSPYSQVAQRCGTILDTMRAHFTIWPDRDEASRCAAHTCRHCPLSFQQRKNALRPFCLTPSCRHCRLYREPGV